ncbi:exopolyphosphatase [Clostridium sp. 19966]|uniref:exopolyphosphatase n=1 Tax=Clostridium sp. 19966 TaxID=2768166 RepID=UPI0028E073EF|nr:exopolyphosphatase [Clostridium sp. 19966]MDT8717222.1 exopolyphosphatase [Clostridium sp. 19966]
MNKTAIIDIGSNSIRMVIIAIDNKSFRIVDELKETVRLGMDMTEDGSLNSERMDKAFKTLSFFKALCHAQNIHEIKIVATEAVRKASNQKEFLNLIKSSLNLDIKILSGKEEAYYDYFGVVNSLDIPSALLMDIGGSSTELIWMDNRKIKESISLPMGAINITERFSLENALDEGKEKALNKFLNEKFDEVPWLKEVKNLPLIGIGGSIRNIAKIHSKKENYPLDTLHNYVLKIEDVRDIHSSVKTKDLNQRKKIRGLSKDRADVFLGPLSSVMCIINKCSINKVIVSGSGIREGLIYEHILNGTTPVEDVFQFSLENHMGIYEIDVTHAQQVWKLSHMLYLELIPLLNTSTSSHNILKTASLLHDCGIRINYYNHQELSYHIIIRSKLNGLSHKELLMAAYVSALHRKNEFKVDEKHYETILNSDDMAIIEKLGLLLRISENLDRAMNSNVKKLYCNISEDEVKINVLSDSDASLEINSAMDCSNAFKRIFNKKLTIV